MIKITLNKSTKFNFPKSSNRWRLTLLARSDRLISCYKCILICLSKLVLVFSFCCVCISAYAVSPTYRGYATNGWVNEYQTCLSSSKQAAAECGCLAWNPGVAFVCPGKWLKSGIYFTPHAKGMVHCTRDTSASDDCADYGILGDAWMVCPAGNIA
jgi:hypothetical protein